MFTGTAFQTLCDCRGVPFSVSYSSPSRLPIKSAGSSKSRNPAGKWAGKRILCCQERCGKALGDRASYWIPYQVGWGLEAEAFQRKKNLLGSKTRTSGPNNWRGRKTVNLVSARRTRRASALRWQISRDGQCARLFAWQTTRRHGNSA